jgi:hypothetical protein
MIRGPRNVRLVLVILPVGDLTRTAETLGQTESDASDPPNPSSENVPNTLDTIFFLDDLECLTGFGIATADTTGTQETMDHLLVGHFLLLGLESP